MPSIQGKPIPLFINLVCKVWLTLPKLEVNILDDIWGFPEVGPGLFVSIHLLSNYKNWRQSVMTLKQEVAGTELDYSKTYSSFRWSPGDGWRSCICHSKDYYVCSFINPKGSKGTWVLPYTNQTWLNLKRKYKYEEEKIYKFLEHLGKFYYKEFQYWKCRAC